MQVLRMGRALLEDQPMRKRHSQSPLPIQLEQMIDAKQAAAALCLPYYWFSDQAMRSKFRIPHYLMGSLVRFRLSELTIWANQNSAAQKRPISLEGDGA